MLDTVSFWAIFGWQPSLRILGAGILILLLLGIVLKYLRSPGFHDLVEDICFMLSAIEREGRDARPWRAQPFSSPANVEADVGRLELPGRP